MASYYAFAPSIKSDVPARILQTHAVSVVAHGALAMQSDWIRRLVLAVPNSEGDAPQCSAEVASDMTVKVVTWQWDETSQRIRGCLESQPKSEKVAHRKVAVQVMMQTGAVTIYKVGNRTCRMQESSGCFARGLALTEQTSDFILEGLSRSMPFFFDTPASLDASLSDS